MSIAFSLELPPGGSDDEVSLQTVKCADCEFGGIAVYRESRRGSLSSESWHHDGYEVTEHSLLSLMETLVLCPSPADRRCRCSTHQSLGTRHWSDPAQNGIEVKREFRMNLVK